MFLGKNSHHEVTLEPHNIAITFVENTVQDPTARDVLSNAINSLYTQLATSTTVVALTQWFAYYVFRNHTTTFGILSSSPSILTLFLAAILSNIPQGVIDFAEQDFTKFVNSQTR